MLDELDGSWFPLHTLLTLLDPFPKPITYELKGGGTKLKVDTVVITTNITPLNWYSEDVWRHRDINSLLRRFTEIHHFYDTQKFNSYFSVIPGNLENSAWSYFNTAVLLTHFK